MSVSGQNPFPRLAKVREQLREKAAEIVDLYLENVVDAKESGDHETAAKSLQWLMEHMPADEDGTKLVDHSVDKVPKEKGGYSGPSINIGFALGGVKDQKGLPAVEVKQLPAAVNEDE
jgi:hypothetical protein